MKALISTQTRENYGDADSPYWKNKGGREFFILDVNPNEYAKVIKFADDTVNSKNEYYEEYVIDVSFVEDDYMTDFEKSQLQYDGKIIYPAEILEM